jgi:hypothetical protein
MPEFSVPDVGPPTRDAGGWIGQQVMNNESRWRRRLPRMVVDELMTAARTQVGRAESPSIVDQTHRTLPRSSHFISSVRTELWHGLGFVVLSGFPLDADIRATEWAYWMLCRLLGRPVSQNRGGDMIVHVEPARNSGGRAYHGSESLSYHTDRTDLIGLLCVRAADSGGMSRMVSARSIHDLLLKESPGLLSELYESLPLDLRGEQMPGVLSWCELPVFARAGNSLTARYLRHFIESSQKYPDAHRLSIKQRDAMDAFDRTSLRPGLALEFYLEPGDVQLINNSQVLHGRSAISSGDLTRGGRLLLRIWLASSESPELPATYSPLYGATGAGTYRGGVWPLNQFPANLGERLPAIE